MTKKILIDFEKSKDPFSGLGQFCLFLKQYFDQSSLTLDYFIPKNRKLMKAFPFLIPHADIFHAIHQDCPYVPFFRSTKYILTIHDLNAIHENDSLKFRHKYLKSLQKKINRANVITCISEFTLKELRTNLNIENTVTEIIYNGIALPSDSKRPSLIPTKKYFFSIGTVLPKKNFHVLIDLCKRLPDFQFVLAGNLFHPYAKEMLNKIKTEKLEDRFFFVGTITNEEKKWYYQNAEAFIFPSLFEGFGLPVAEAMSFGLPLFLSNKTSIPEIGGPDAFYFDDFSPEHMEKVIVEGLLHFNLERKNRLIERSKMFNWEKAALKYLEIYNRL